MAQFGKPIDDVTRGYLEEEGFGDGRTRAVGCMGWIWSQWLERAPAIRIRETVEPFVARGMEMQRSSSKFYLRPVHDLYLLHCAIFASSDSQLNDVAKGVIDASGFQNYTPHNDGELYASAWCGMLKYWILGKREKAIEQSDVIWKAYRDPSCRAATKQLVQPWLKDDWELFSKRQTEDFQKLWDRARKDKTVLSENDFEIEVDMEKMSSVQQLWCWAHCGLALLAFRSGVEVKTDPFWLPSFALECVRCDKNRLRL